MTLMDTIRARHSVRRYDGRAPEGFELEALQKAVDGCAAQSGLNIQLVLHNPEVFQMVARFGIVRGAESHISFVTSRGTVDDEAIGYWGQKIVLVAQEVGLNTCWVAMCARRKDMAVRATGETTRLVVAVGYGVHPGKPRPTKSAEEISNVLCEQTPSWFTTAVEAAQLAPTAMNNQHFHLTLAADGKTVSLKTPTGALDSIDRGIVRRNFEEAANELGADWCWG